MQELEKRLEELWDKADKLASGSSEYAEIVEEVLYIRNFCRKNHISLRQDIAARF